MQCPRCQQENPPQAKFCLECATPLALTCPNCGTQVPASAKFCLECAHPLAAASPTALIAQARFSSPESYTPRHLAEKILTSKSALEGERKQVTVLFADLKGSMELLADRDPEEARKLLDPVLERMMEAVHHYEGTVNQVMGDGIMALFGAPLAHEDHAVRACYAALRMQEEVTRYGDEVRRAEGLPIQIRVGLNSGEVVVRSIGSDLHMDYTAVGQTTHLAARMEQAATPASILITAHTLRLAEGYVQVKPLGPVNIKGLSGPVEAYEVSGAGLVRTRFQAATVRGLTRFVGRDAELEQLRRALQLTADGHGQVVAVVGEAGVGKSRLVYEFTHSHRMQGWLILESGSVSYGKATSYLPVIELLKTYFKIQDRDDHREIREKAIGKLLALERALEPLLPAFLGLLHVPVDAPEWQALDPSQRRQRTLDAVKRLLLRESQVQPLLVIFEDLHWIDSETQAFLDSLVESLPAARILVLVNYRPEYQHGWSRKTYYGQLRLDTLPAESAEELLHALLGGHAGLAPLRQHLIARTGGNPFFLEESVRTLVETGALVGERGSYLLAHPATSVQVPATVQAILAARIDRLPAEDKQLLQAASVVGKDIPFALLQAIAELPEDALRRVLTGLQGAEFLYESRLFPDLEYTFKHALTHEVAYGSLLQERRRLLHTRIVDAIETLHAGRLAEHVERLGQHAFRGEVWDKAFQYLRQAGVKAFDRSASREAVACLEQALVALDRLPESRATLEQAIDLRFDLRSAFAVVGDLDRALGVLREAEPLAERLEDRGRLAWISGYLAGIWNLRGEYRRGVELGERALAIAEAVGDHRLPIAASTYLGVTHFSLGDYRKSIAHHRRTVESIDPELIGQRFGMAISPFALSWGQLAQCHAELGEFAEGLACARESLRVAEIAIQPFNRIYADVGAGHIHCRAGELHRAIPPLEHALALCRSTGIRAMIPTAAVLLGEAYALAGRLPEALPLLEQAVDETTSMGVALFRSYALASLGHAYLLAGRGAEALERARQALEFSRSHGERGWEAWSLRLLGEIHSHSDRFDVAAAEGSYCSALALAGELGMRPLVARAHLGLGRLCGRSGRAEAAAEHFTTAARLFGGMDMGFWLEKAEAEFKE